MEKAIIISRCSTNENRQDVTRQSQELISNYGHQYEIVKEFTYYKSGTKNDEVNAEILDYAINHNVKHIIAIEISRISRKISSFALFLEKCNENKINIIIDNFKLHTLLPSGEINGEPTVLRLIHFPKETEAFFWANNPAPQKNISDTMIIFIS